MKATLISAILLTLSAVDAKKHRLCCCYGIDEDAPGKWSDKSAVCVQKPNEQIVASSKGYFIMSNQLWNYNKDKRYPLEVESKNWFYAADIDFGNDNWVGGNEASDLCNAKGYNSKCFSPGSNEYRNPGTYQKRSQNVDQDGKFVDVTGGSAILERDLVERKANGTKSTHKKGKTSSHKHSSHKNSTSHSSSHKKNSTSHSSTHKKNSTSTKHHSKPATTAVADFIERDLMERDLVERKANGTKSTKNHGTGHGKNTTSTHGKNTTSTHAKNTTSTKHHYTPSTTPIAHLKHVDKQTNGTHVNATKPHHASGKPWTTFSQVTKSHHHYGNGTNAALGHANATGGYAKPTGTATPSSGIVYCNQYWKAPGCVDKPDPAATPVVCGQYWKAKGCVPAKTGSS
ncbi:hypothetical protein BLS_009882 [Venturia inaequalis]|uniref:Uncharacterized protein n=1 Tax=Venturia inaequalis TaxID=5025 RepID=A0A8H3U465_VENIN|nr:hypothetical protein BLS_009882 [Venturia inaequalis]